MVKKNNHNVASVWMSNALNVMSILVIYIFFIIIIIILRMYIVLFLIKNFVSVPEEPAIPKVLIRKKESLNSSLCYKFLLIIKLVVWFYYWKEIGRVDSRH
jgi:hypothetical protein